MSYTPAWNATFGKPLLNQLIAIIQRDQAAAISIVNPQLASISYFCKGPATRTGFPWLTLAADSAVFDHEASGTRKSVIRVALTLDVGQFEGEMAVDNAQDYARMLDVVVTSASSSDFETALPIVHLTVPGGWTSPPAAGSVKEAWVESHNYTSVRPKEIEVPVICVTLKIQFVLEET
jgi:hypothetical protein